MSRTIEIHDVGPIEEFTYEMTESGLHVLTGPHGAGKTTILRTVELAANGATDEKPTKRRGTTTGTATVCGKKVTVKKKVTTSGELEIEGLGDLDITAIHWPKLQDRTKRDAQRVKALVRLSGVDASRELFAGLPDIDAITDGVDLPDADLVVMAEKIKRAYEKEARAVEDQQSKAEARRNAALEQTRDIDLTAEVDMASLAKQQADAITAQRKLIDAAAEAVEINSKAKRAEAWLAKNPALPRTADDNRRSIENCTEQIESLKDQIAALQQQLAGQQEALSVIRDEGQKIADYDRDAKTCRDAVQAKAECTPPTTDQMIAAIEAVEAAGEAIVQAQKITQAKSAKSQADEYDSEAKTLAKRAAELRTAAQSVANVLTEAVASIPDCPIQASFDEDGNVVLTTEDGIPFDEKSDGERWKIILPICFRPGRLITISQAAFGELSEDTKEFLDTESTKSDCCLLSGQVTDDDTKLRGMKWSRK